VYIQTLAGGPGSYPFAAGLRYDVDYTQAFGERILNLEYNPRLEGSWALLDLEDTKTVYVIVTNSFVASGRDGYFTFSEVGNGIDTFSEYGQSFVNYVLSLETVEEPPLSEYSTQSITLADGTVYSVPESEAENGGSSPTDVSGARTWVNNMVVMAVPIAGLVQFMMY
jgi:5'-nucleotidase